MVSRKRERERKREWDGKVIKIGMERERIHGQDDRHRI